MKLEDWVSGTAKATNLFSFGVEERRGTASAFERTMQVKWTKREVREGGVFIGDMYACGYVDRNGKGALFHSSDPLQGRRKRVLQLVLVQTRRIIFNVPSNGQIKAPSQAESTVRLL